MSGWEYLLCALVSEPALVYSR